MQVIGRFRSRSIHLTAKTNTLRNQAHKAAQPSADKRIVLDRAAWIAEAKLALIEGGISSIKIGRLATRLDVTRESFYWHFKNIQELHDELLSDWESNTAEIFESILDPEHDGTKEFLSMVKIYLDEHKFNPAWDSAVRDWARISKPAELAVRSLDERIVEIIKLMFLNMGYEDIEALVRARISHFHQIGYYKINPGESREERIRLLPVYIRLLTGFPLMG